MIFPISICSIPTCRASTSRSAARAAERAALAVKGVTKSGGASASAGIGGMVLVTSGGFRGASLGSRHSVSMAAIAGEGTGMERDYDFSSARHGADLEAAEKIGRTAGERAVKRLNPRKVTTRRVPVVFDQRMSGSLVGHLATATTAPSIARKTSFLRDKLGKGFSPPASASSTIRCGRADCARSPSMPRASRRAQLADRERRAQILDARLRERARARPQTTGHAQRGVSSAPSPGATNLHLEAGTSAPTS